MTRWKLFTAAALVATVAAEAPDVAAANGGHVHFGATYVPLAVVYVFGGFVGLVVVFFVVNWARYRRAQTRSGLERDPEGAQEKEEDDGTG